LDLKKEIHQREFASEKEEVFVNLIFIGALIKDRLNEVFQTKGILSQHYNVLRILKGAENKQLFPSQIKERMIEKGVDLTRLLIKLENLEYVKRKVCSDNRRRVEVEITEDGLEVIQDLHGSLKQIEDRFFSAMTDDEVSNLRFLLQKTS